MKIVSTKKNNKSNFYVIKNLLHKFFHVYVAFLNWISYKAASYKNFYFFISFIYFNKNNFRTFLKRQHKFKYLFLNIGKKYKSIKKFCLKTP